MLEFGDLLLSSPAASPATRFDRRTTVMQAGGRVPRLSFFLRTPPSASLMSRRVSHVSHVSFKAPRQQKEVESWLQSKTPGKPAASGLCAIGEDADEEAPTAAAPPPPRMRSLNAVDVRTAGRTAPPPARGSLLRKSGGLPPPTASRGASRGGARAAAAAPPPGRGGAHGAIAKRRLSAARP
jgi:hypothetical protein